MERPSWGSNRTVYREESPSLRRWFTLGSDTQLPVQNQNIHSYIVISSPFKDWLPIRRNSVGVLQLKRRTERPGDRGVGPYTLNIPFEPPVCLVRGCMTYVGFNINARQSNQQTIKVLEWARLHDCVPPTRAPEHILRDKTMHIVYLVHVYMQFTNAYRLHHVHGFLVNFCTLRAWTMLRNSGKRGLPSLGPGAGISAIAGHRVWNGVLRPYDISQYIF